jgi:probable rRNA maturation factor
MTRPAKRAAELPATAGRKDPGAARTRRPARPALSLSLQLADPRHRDVLKRASVARWIRAALDAAAEMTVRVVDEEEGRSLNQGWRGKDQPTNVLTFAYDEGPSIHADLVLCAPVVEREAREQALSLEAHYAHLIVHGTLHAQGLDHELDADATRMEARETQILAALGFPDPYAG